MSFVSDERRLREELAAAYRIIARRGLTTLIQNHITVRLPGPDRQFLINPYGLAYEEVTASSLVVIDLEGRLVRAGAGPFGSNVNPAGFVVHRAVHEHRADVVCAVHVHSVAGSAVSALECGLLPLSIEAMMFTNSVGYHDFEGVTLEREECARIARALGTNRVLVLRNHGLLTVGASVAEALVAMLNLERACEVQIAAMSSGSAVVRPEHAIALRVAEQAQRFVPDDSVEARTFAALVRELDRTEPEFRR